MSPARDRRDELYDAYLRVPEHQHAEIVNGTLYVMSRPSPRHADAASMLGIELGGPFRRGRGGPGGWWILDEPELQLVPKEPVIPDLAGWRVERMPQLPDTACFTLAPDWVCEVLSRSTEKLDRDEKLPYYASHGVLHAWLLDPIDKRLEEVDRALGEIRTMASLGVVLVFRGAGPLTWVARCLHRVTLGDRPFVALDPNEAPPQHRHRDRHHPCLRAAPAPGGMHHPDSADPVIDLPSRLSRAATTSIPPLTERLDELAGLLEVYSWDAASDLDASEISSALPEACPCYPRLLRWRSDDLDDPDPA